LPVQHRSFPPLPWSTMTPLFSPKNFPLFSNASLTIRFFWYVLYFPSSFFPSGKEGFISPLVRAVVPLFFPPSSPPCNQLLKSFFLFSPHPRDAFGLRFSSVLFEEGGLFCPLSIGKGVFFFFPLFSGYNRLSPFFLLRPTTLVLLNFSGAGVDGAFFSSPFFPVGSQFHCVSPQQFIRFSLFFSLYSGVFCPPPCGKTFFPLGSPPPPSGLLLFSKRVSRGTFFPFFPSKRKLLFLPFILFLPPPLRAPDPFLWRLRPPFFFFPVWPFLPGLKNFISFEHVMREVFLFLLIRPPPFSGPHFAPFFQDAFSPPE